MYQFMHLALDSALPSGIAPGAAARLRRCASSSVSIPPPRCLLGPLEAPLRYMFGPGPSNVPPRILAAGGRPIIGHMHEEMFEIMDDIKQGIQYAFQTQNNMTIAASGSGHTAMECALFNCVEPGEPVLVAINGIWGERVAEIARRIGADVKTLVKTPGGYFTNEEIEQALAKHKPVLFFLTHGESSAGLVHPMDGIGDLCRKHNCLFLVDSVASLGGASLFMDKQNIDILYTGSQKALNGPPGTAPVSFNDRACKKMFSRKTKPGLENSWKLHKEVAEYLHEGLEGLGLKLFVQDKNLRLPCVTTIAIPVGYNWREITQYVMKHHRMEITGGLGPSVGMVLRVGLMGYNCSKTNADKVLVALGDALKHCHKSKV
uniref:Alanine--glyoxylate aminotransferase n=1 Tax=Scleropages formosus TaxID=113540 RepID=A0A8C9SQJ5_SCLFO